MVKLLDWNVFSQTCTLENIATGETVKLSPRTMDVLNYLIDSHGQVVSSAELLDKHWSNSVSSDHAVHNAIAELRSALGDHASNPRYIKTYPKRGYSLIASPERVEFAPISDRGDESKQLWSSRRISWKTGFVASSALLVLLLINLWIQSSWEDRDTHVVLVRPIANINVEEQNLFWADQLPSSLVTHLSKLPDIVIVSGFGDLTAAQYVQSNYAEDIDYILGGNVQQAGDALRLQVNLSNAKDNSIAFSDQIDISSADVFDVHDEIGRSIVSALSIYLDDEQYAEMQDWGTSNPIAYSNFLEAGFYAGNSNHNDLEHALQHYNVATEEDPGFINAYVGLVRAASSLSTYSHEARNIDLQSQVNDAIRAVSRVKPGHDSLTEMRIQLLSMQSQSLSLIESTLREKILSGANEEYFYARYATLLAEARLYDEATQFLSRVSDEEPFQVPRRSTWLYQTFFETPDNLIQTQKGILLERPDHIGIMSALIRGLAFVGDYQQAISYLQKQMNIDEEGPFTMLSQVTISGLWGRSTETGDLFEQNNLLNPDYNMSHGVKSFILGDIESGISYWRSLSPADWRRLSFMAHKVEMYFPDHVLMDSRYQDMLEELDLGISWQRQLMEGVNAMSSVTGITLSPSSLSAYESNVFMSQNNLWDHSQVLYPNRGEGPISLPPGSQ